MSQQCQQAYNRASRILGLLHRTIQYKNTGILLRLYKSLVRPHVEYCISAWSPYYKKDKILIEKIQRRFTRMIPSVKSLPYQDRLEQLNLWSLEDRRIRADLIQVFKIIHGISSIKFRTFFEYSTYDRTRGHSLKLVKKRARLDLRQHFFSERVVNMWNSLDNDTVRASSVNSFKRHLQTFHKDGSFARLRQSV